MWNNDIVTTIIDNYNKHPEHFFSEIAENTKKTGGAGGITNQNKGNSGDIE